MFELRYILITAVSAWEALPALFSAALPGRIHKNDLIPWYTSGFE